MVCTNCGKLVSKEAVQVSLSAGYGSRLDGYMVYPYCEECADLTGRTLLDIANRLHLGDGIVKLALAFQGVDG